MRKVYIVDLIILIVNIVCFFAYIYLKNDMSMIGLFIYAVFLVVQLFINLRLKIVMKFNPQFNLSWKDYLYIFLLFLANIQFLLVLLNNITWLYWSVVHFGFLSLFVLDYSYISNNKLIYKLNEVIDIGNIEYIEVQDKAFGDIYIYAYFKNTKKTKKIKFKLTNEEYEYLRQEI